MLLELVDVTKRYEGVEGGEGPDVLKGVSLSIKAGETVSIVGPSGSGKSTLLNIIGTLDRPTTGTITFDGRDLSALSDAELAAFRNQQIGFIFQAHHLLPQLSVMENVLVPTLATSEGQSASEAAARAKDLLERVGLSHRINHRPGTISGGERQRVAVVRSLINKPKMLLADEPTGALDQHTAEELSKTLRKLNEEEGVTLVVVTHALHLADEMSRKLELEDGRLVGANAKPQVAGASSGDAS